MKLEIEIPEEDLKGMLESKIKVLVSGYLDSYAASYYTEQGLRDEIKRQWEATASALIKEEVENSAKMREMIKKSMENKIRGQLNFLMKTEQGIGE